MMRFIMIVVFLLLSIYSLYSSYTEYKNYQIVQNSDNSIIWIRNLNLIFTTVEQERTQSAIYLGYEGKTDFSVLEDLRNSSDNALQIAQEFSNLNPEFIIDKSYMSKINEALQYVRSRVDVISNDHNAILFTYYENDIVSPLLVGIKDNIKQMSLGFPNMKNNLSNYIDILDYRKNIENERSFIAFILSHSKRMSKDDLIQWEGILSQNIAADIDDLILNSQELNTLLSGYRSEIISRATGGQYSISIFDWFNGMDEKISRVKTVENIIFTKFTDTVNSTVLSKKWIMLYGVASIIFLLLVLILLFSKKKTKHKRRNDISDLKVDKDDELNIDSRDVKTVVGSEIKKDEEELFSTHEVFTKTVKPLAVSPEKLKPTIPNIASNANEMELFNTLEMFIKTIEPLKQYARQKGISFDYYIEPYIPSFCMGNIERIKQILTLLIKHAIKETASSGTVDVKIEKNAESKAQSILEFSVTDSSGYISKGLKSKIDNVVHDGSSKNMVLGNRNIDLIFVAKSVLRMGGTNSIKSKSKDGSTYSFTLSLKRV